MHTSHAKNLLAIAGLLLLIAAGCGEARGEDRVDDEGGSLRIHPSRVELIVGAKQRFSARGALPEEARVRWAVSDEGGGTIDETGLYQAPTNEGTYTVVAELAGEDAAEMRATAQVIVRSDERKDGRPIEGEEGEKVTIAIEPAVVEVPVGGKQRFTAVVHHADDEGVSWSLQEGEAGGTIDESGLYTAPDEVGTFHVVATSLADPGTRAVAEVTVVRPIHTDANGLLPPESRTVWRPGLNAVGGIPSDTDSERPARIHLPDGNPYGGFSVDPQLGDGSRDARRAIQSALDAAGRNARENDRRVVLLAAGEYRVGGDGLFIPSYVTLRGQGPRGPNATRLVKPRGTSTAVINMGHRWFGTTQPIDLAQDAPHGSYSVTLQSNPGYQVGELVFIDQKDDPERVGSWWNPLRQRPGDGSRSWFSRRDRPTGQALEIIEVDGNRLTFNTPLRLTYYTSNDAQVFRYSGNSNSVVPNMKWSGVEDLYVAYGEGGDGGGNIHLFATSYSWVKNVESVHSSGTSVAFEATFRSVLRDSFVHSTVDPNPGGAGYGIGLLRWAADNLIENNISWNFNKTLIMRATGGGNVIGYNYFEDGWGSGYTTIPEVGLNAAHYATPHHELLEGNQAWNIAGDAFWGNSIHLTFYRNHVTGRRRSVPPLRLVDEVGRRFVEVPEWQLWSSYLGNVLGSPGMSSSPQRRFVYEASPPWPNDPVPVWKVGTQHNAGEYGQDQRVVQTTIRHGNFDYVTNDIIWQEGIERRDMPPSLYLESKPAFFGSTPWPWVEAENEGRIHTLPARERFDEMMGL